MICTKTTSLPIFDVLSFVYKASIVINKSMTCARQVEPFFDEKHLGEVKNLYRLGLWTLLS